LEPRYRDETFRPRISSKGHSYSGAGNNHAAAAGGKTQPIHERLYDHALKKMHQDHNKFVQTLSDAVQNIEFKPWEEHRTQSGKDKSQPAWVANNRTHVGKNLLGPALNDLLILDGDSRTIATAEINSVAMMSVWRSVQGAKVLADEDEMGFRPESHEENDQTFASYGRMKMSDF